MTLERFNEIKARCEAATDGPWHENFSVYNGSEVWGATAAVCCIREGFTERGYANMAFITDARQDLPDCTKEIERLRGILTGVATKHGLLKDLSGYGPCKCHPGESLCMKHGAADILNMIRTALEE